MDINNISDKPLAQLGFSDNFIRDSASMGLKTLDDVLRKEPREFAMASGFSFHWLAELGSYLAKNGLLHLLQPLPGSSPG